MRLDIFMVEQGLAPTRTKAQAFIMSGNVYVNGQKCDKPGTMVKATDVVHSKQKEAKYVSRGGEKLEGAIKAWALDFTNATVLDVGLSTGGFTDCVLQHGAKAVIGVDVGYGIVDFKLRQSVQVAVIERVNARHLSKDDLLNHLSIEQKPWLEAVSWVVMDVSFISVLKVIPNVLSWLQTPVQFLILIKPQFEAEPHEIGSGGIIRDEQLQKDIVQRVVDGLSPLLTLKNLIPSPLKGSKGNQEYIGWFVVKGRIL